MNDGAKKLTHPQPGDVARDFFEKLWTDDIPAGSHLVVWSPKGAPQWCETIDAAAKAVAVLSPRSDVYYGVALQDRPRALAIKGENTRGTTATATFIPGLWADVDVLGPGHAALNLPPDLDAARELIGKLRLAPSALVYSGGGIQPYWFLAEPWELDSDEERGRAAALSASWIGTLQAHAETKGWKVDSTKDLARVLRVPGTFNRKKDPVQVTVEYTGHRYNPGDFEEHCFVQVPARVLRFADTKIGGEVNEADLYVAIHTLTCLGKNRSDDRDQWIQVGMVLKGIGDTADTRRAWHEFSKLSDKYDEGDVEKTWETLQPDGRITLGSLIKWARDDAGRVRGWDDDDVASAFERMTGKVVGRDAEAPEPKAAAAGAVTPKAVGRHRVANVMDGTYEDKSGKEQRQTYYIPLPDIAERINTATDGWPRRVGGLLFALGTVPEDRLPGRGAIQYLGGSDRFFGWLQKHCDVRWATGQAQHPGTRELVTPPTKKELHAYLEDNAQPTYAAAEALPHHPPVDDVFYLPVNLPAVTAGDDTPLGKLIDALNPETEADRSFMLAALLTPGWGGPAGARPAFVFTSDHGRGVGKTATATVLAEIWGGAIGIGGNEDWDQIRKRLLGDDSLAKRVCVIDNVKGKLQGGDIEGAITSRHIDGWKPYHGQASRLNLLTWYITANTPTLSRDLADRSVIIKVGRQKHGSDFIRWAHEHIFKHRAEIIAEALDILRDPPACEIPRSARDRWGAWQDAILSRFADGDELAAMAIERRPAVDSDLDDAEEIAGCVIEMIEQHFPDHQDRRIFITRQQIYQRLQSKGIVGKEFSTKGVTSWVRNQCGTGPLANLKDHKHVGTRGWLWVGDNAGPHVYNVDELPVDPHDHYGWNK